MALCSRVLRYVVRGDERGFRSTVRAIVVKLERLRRRDRWRRSPRRLLPSVDRVPLDRPIFVLGMQGGGRRSSSPRTPG